jgi:hypothetical protein
MVISVPLLPAKHHHTFWNTAPLQHGEFFLRICAAPKSLKSYRQLLGLCKHVFLFGNEIVALKNLIRFGFKKVTIPFTA